MVSGLMLITLLNSVTKYFAEETEDQGKIYFEAEFMR